MAIVPSGLQWSCDESFLNAQSGRFATISGRGYYKTNDVPAICGCHYNSSNYTMPVLISTDESAISFRADSGGPWTHNTSFEYLGLTWYYNWGDHGFYNATPTTSYPVLNDKSIGAYNSEAVGKWILEQAGVVILPSYKVRFDHSAGYGVMKDQYIYCGEATALRANTFVKSDHSFVGWDTDESADTVVYTDGQSVTDIAREDETITLYAVWRKSWAWLLGDSSGKIYTVTRDEETGVQERTQVTGISSLTAAVFYEHGFQFLPNDNVIIDLRTPRIFKWNDSEAPELYAAVEAVPLVPQIVVFNTITLGSTVKYINIDGDENTLWNVSFDGGNNWYKYNGGWVRVTQNGDGCEKRKLEILTASDWAAKVNGSLKFRCWLVADSWVKRIRVDY